MKIRTDFVTNSSSTSFVIITSDDLTEARFLELMGIEESSPFVQVFQHLYESLGVKASYAEDDLTFQNRIEGRLIPQVKKKIEEARAQGKQVYLGELSSDANTVESFFCTDYLKQKWAIFT